MKIIIGTSVIIAVITNEEHKPELIALTRGQELIAPLSLHWEIGNAFTAMFKRKRITLENAIAAYSHYNKIPISFKNIEMKKALELSFQYQIYAYDAYFLVCAMQYNSPLLSLDRRLNEIAENIGINILGEKK